MQLGGLPTARERRALIALASVQWKFEPQLSIGPRTKAAMFAKAWIEYVDGQDRCVRITDAGREALRAPVLRARRTRRNRLLKPLLGVVGLDDS